MTYNDYQPNRSNLRGHEQKDIAVINAIRDFLASGEPVEVLLACVSSGAIDAQNGDNVTHERACELGWLSARVMELATGEKY